MQPIVITGFMGSGKTTVARALARLLNCRAIDLDQANYRKRKTNSETESSRRMANQLSAKSKRAGCARRSSWICARVIALGGGAWTLQRNRELIAEHNGFTVWLDAPFELCWQRIAASGSERPLAPNREQARNLYLQRRHLYQLASLPLIADGKTDVDGLAATIARAIEKGQ